MKRISLISFVIFHLIFLGCENEAPEHMGDVKCMIDSKNTGTTEGRLKLERGYIHLSKVEVSGSKNGASEAAHVSFETPAQFFFIGNDPGQPVKVPIAEASYSDPMVHLYFYRDSYQLQLKDTVYNSGGTDEGEDGHGSDDDDDDNGDDGDDDDNGDDDGDDGDDGDDDDNEGDDNDDDDDKGGDDDGRIKGSVKSKTVDLLHFIQNAKPSLVLLGDYLYLADTIQVMIALDLNELSLRPTAGVAEPLIVRKESEITATATFQPGYWFDTITESEISNAALINFRGTTVLFIHRKFNTSLHDIVAGKIAASTQMRFVTNNNF